MGSPAHGVPEDLGGGCGQAEVLWEARGRSWGSKGSLAAEWRMGGSGEGWGALVEMGRGGTISRYAWRQEGQDLSVDWTWAPQGLPGAATQNTTN